MEKYLNLTAGEIIAMDWKISEVKTNIANGKKSHSKNLPPLVSYFPDERKYLIMDGHHRTIENFSEGVKEIRCLVSEHQPKIFNIGYAYSTIKKAILTT